MSNETIENDAAVSKPAGRNLQLVHAGASEFGIFADEISTIVVWQEPTPLPHAPKAVLGVVSIEGRMLTVLDLAVLAAGDGASGNAPSNTAAYLIALRGDEQLALAVEAVNEIIALTPNDSISDSIAKPETQATPLHGILKREDAEVKILNLKGLFPTAIHEQQRRNRRF